MNSYNISLHCVQRLRRSVAFFMCLQQKSYPRVEIWYFGLMHGTCLRRAMRFFATIVQPMVVVKDYSFYLGECVCERVGCYASELISCIWPLSIIMHKFRIHNNLAFSLCPYHVFSSIAWWLCYRCYYCTYHKTPILSFQMFVMFNLIFSTTKMVTYSMVILLRVCFLPLSSLLISRFLQFV